MKRISRLLLLSIFLASCANVATPTLVVTETSARTTTAMFTPTSTEAPTATPEPTKTPDPLGGAPEGATGKDSKGNYIKEVTENGYEYPYTYNAELGQWVREVAYFPIYDWPTFNSMQFKIFITEGTLGERNLYQMTHKDFTVADIPPGGIFDPPPITASIAPKLEERYFADDTRGLLDSKKFPTLLLEMQGKGEKGHEQAYMPIILSNGEDAQVKLGTDTGIILTIMDKDTLLKLGGDLVSTWYISGVTVYYEVYGIDAAGNELCRLAIDGSIADLSDRDLRIVLMFFPTNFAKNIDQRDQGGMSAFGQAMAIVSAQPQPDGVAQDLTIERISLAQP